MNKHLLFSAFALMCCLTACEKNDDPTPAPQPSRIGGTLVMATTVLNPSGNSGSCYVQTLTDTADVSIDNNRAIPGGFGNPFTVQGKNVYIFPDYMGQSKAALQRFVIDANHQRFCSFAGHRSKRSHSLCFVPELRKSARLRL